ncbi:MAG TPA: GtrA family protein, partial [Paludibacteraceae bacterium]|nr:GtrA family protein [Paludibacteraceae bacterium]
MIKKIESKIQKFLWVVIDFFYQPFSKFFSLQFFRYGFCGGLNMAFDWVLYFVFYNFVFQKQLLDLGFVAISPHIA